MVAEYVQSPWQEPQKNVRPSRAGQRHFPPHSDEANRVICCAEHQKNIRRRQIWKFQEWGKNVHRFPVSETPSRVPTANPGKSATNEPFRGLSERAGPNIGHTRQWHCAVKIFHPTGKMSYKRTAAERVDCKNMRPARGALTSQGHTTSLSRTRGSRSVRPVTLRKPIRMEVGQRRARQVRLLCPLFHGLVEARTMENHLRASPRAEWAIFRLQ